MEQTSVVPNFFHLEGVNIAELGFNSLCFIAFSKYLDILNDLVENASLVVKFGIRIFKVDGKVFINPNYYLR